LPPDERILEEVVHMNRVLLLLMPLAAVSVSAEAQYPWSECVPGQVLISIKAASLDGLNSDGLLRGELRTGLASLDALIERTGVTFIEPLGFLNGVPDVFLLQFPESIDLPAMVAMYAQNEHVLLAEPNYPMPTAVRAAPWSLMKRATR
jgi:hypothetical protein